MNLKKHSLHLVENTVVPTGVGKVKDEDADEEMFSRSKETA